MKRFGKECVQGSSSKVGRCQYSMDRKHTPNWTRLLDIIPYLYAYINKNSEVVNGWLWLWKCWHLNPINVTLALSKQTYIKPSFRFQNWPKCPCMWYIYLLGFGFKFLSGFNVFSTFLPNLFLYFSFCLCQATLH